MYLLLVPGLLHLSLESFAALGQLALPGVVGDVLLLLLGPLLGMLAPHVAVQIPLLVVADPLALEVADSAPEHPLASVLVLEVPVPVGRGTEGLAASFPGADKRLEFQVNSVDVPLEILGRGEALATVLTGEWPQLLVNHLDVPGEAALPVELLPTGAALEVSPDDATMLPSVVLQHLPPGDVVLATPGTLSLSAWLTWMRKVLRDAMLHHGVRAYEGLVAAMTGNLLGS